MKGVLDLPTVSLHYETQGDGPLFLLIAGMTGTGNSFADLARCLSAHYTVATYDRRGYSQSAIKGDDKAELDEQRIYSTNAQDALALINHLSPDHTTTATVFATSSGAMIALEMLYLQPYRPLSVILHELIMPSVLPPEQEQSSHAWYNSVMQAFQTSGPSGAARLFFPMMTTDEEKKLMKSGRLTRDAPAATAKNMTYFFSTEMGPIAHSRLRPELLVRPGVTLHLTKGVQSTRDMTSWPVQAVSRVLGVPVSLVPGGHLGYVTQPEAFAREIVRVLRGEQTSLL